ncbi:hypothetical protein [Flagellimonas marinaquae]|uniref:hypothetical protein n=1 Tax=Flagellimonas marinaquae TaxID=254955 RepID=UPI0013DF5E98|nr:hypothetical protein [Allomuricauda aquimarina]
MPKKAGERSFHMIPYPIRLKTRDLERYAINTMCLGPPVRGPFPFTAPRGDSLGT